MFYIVIEYILVAFGMASVGLFGLGFGYWFRGGYLEYEDCSMFTELRLNKHAVYRLVTVMILFGFVMAHIFLSQRN